LQGALAFGLVAAVFVLALRRGMPEDELRALVFFTLVTSIFSLILVNRSFGASLVAAFRRPNPALVWILAGVIAILTTSLAWPPASSLFKFGPLHVDDLGLTLAAGTTVLIVLELLKPFWRTQLRL
jgi:Ca2+-transporting ATPase